MCWSKKSFLIFITFLSLCFGIRAQSSKIDSLKKVLLKANQDTFKVATLNKLASTYARTGDLDAALPYFQEAYELSSKLNYHFGIAASLNNLGKVSLGKSAFPAALEYFFKSLEVAERYNFKSGMASAMGNIGIVYDNEKDYNKALRYHYKSLKIEEEIGNLDGVAESYNSIGNIYYYKQNYAKVIECYNKALDIKIKLGDEIGCASTLANIGNIYFYKKEYVKTREYYFKALTYFEKLENLQAIGMLSNNIAETYIGEKNFKEALKYSQKSLQVSTQIGVLDDIKNAYSSLSTIYAGLGNHKLSTDNLRLYIRYNDSIYNDENKRKAIEIDIKYHFDKKATNTRIENERKQIILKEEAEKQKLIIYFGLGFLILVIVFAIYAFRSFKIKQKINAQLSIQKEEIVAQRDEIELQRSIVEEKNKGLTDSINYAKRIQYTLLAHEAYLSENLKEHFVYFQPKDIVSGDFYWATNMEGAAENGGDLFYLAVCDCTGHGVPGAFMSLLSIGFLSEAIKEKHIKEPGEIFNYVRKRLIENISKEEQKDGFDGVLICINTKDNKVTYAAANSEPVLVDGETVSYLLADKMPVGIGITNDSFNTFELSYKKGDTLYIYTDGYADQFGGPKGKKFKYKQLNELLLAASGNDVAYQKENLKTNFDKWKRDLEQVDDVCVVGIRL
ncbi:MAG: tetratricopeptide repeat protein [Sphingobacteriaceae bacterium]|nr:tetratricopeptide repeat protein [Sphingobacteriaceae bacterium]